jgi:hypothetical protein
MAQGKDWSIEITDKLLEYATEKEKEKLRAIISTGSLRKAADFLGINERGVTIALSRVKAKAAKQGYSPEHDMVKTVPEGFKLRGTSTLYGKDGNQKLQWVKTSIDAERQYQLMLGAIEALKEEISPQDLIIQSSSKTDSSLINQYTITDLHFGALCWKPETLDDDYDISIAEKSLIKWFQTAIEKSPDADTAILANIGDLLHSDGLQAVTPSSGHILDADSRFCKVVRVVIRTLRRIINMLLYKHSKVVVILAEGNHDLSASVWLREMFSALYESEPRVTIDNSANPYYCYMHGKTALFYHHGHLSKFDKIDSVMAGMFKREFGVSDHAYCHMGHYHHNKLNESNLMTIEQHQTLAARDAYAARGGWLSGRSAKVITYHKEFGEVGRTIINYAMIKDGE